MVRQVRPEEMMTMKHTRLNRCLHEDCKTVLEPPAPLAHPTYHLRATPGSCDSFWARSGKWRLALEGKGGSYHMLFQP